MANSMTGFGRGTAQSDGRSLTIELKSVNHRYLDISSRLPKTLLFLEEIIRQKISSYINRGHIDVYVFYENTRTDTKTVTMDRALAHQYVLAAKQIEDLMPNGINSANLLQVAGIFKVEEAIEDRDEIANLATLATMDAVNELRVMREIEGKKLCQDMQEKLIGLQEMISSIEKRSPNVVEEYRQRLNNRISELLNCQEVDASRLAMEVAIFADKAGIDEELVRLKSHIKQLKGKLVEDFAVGRKLDFVIQELNREVNTIGSKASDLQIINLVIDAKAEIEKLREQVQNIE